MDKKRGSAVFRIFSGFQKENPIFVISCDRKCVEFFLHSDIGKGGTSSPGFSFNLFLTSSPRGHNVRKMQLGKYI